MKRIISITLILLISAFLMVSCNTEPIPQEPEYDVGPGDWSDFSVNSIEQLIADLSLAKSEGPEKLSEENKVLYNLHELSSLDKLIYPSAFHGENFELIYTGANLSSVSYYYMPIGASNGKHPNYLSWEGIQLQVFREYHEDIVAYMEQLAKHYKVEIRENGTVYVKHTSTDLLMVPYQNTYYSIYTPIGMFTPDEMLKLFDLQVYDLNRQTIVYNPTNIKVRYVEVEPDTEFELSAEGVKTIVSIWNDAEWESQITKTAYDYVFEFSETELRYSSEYGIFNDPENNRHLELTEEERILINSFLD